MRRSIATVSLSGTLQQKLEAAAAARFDAVEIFETDFVLFDGSARDLRAMAGDLGLRIALYQPFRNFEGVEDAELRRNLERAERKFDVMAELGAPLMLVCSNVLPNAIAGDARAAAQLFELAERASRRGLKIGYEALAWGAHVKTYGHAWRIVAEANHPHLGLVLDSFHTLALHDDPAGIAEIPADRVFFVQLADAPRLTMDILSWSRHFRCFPGQGDLDVAGFMAEVIAGGYSGIVSLEIFNDDFRASPTRSTAADGMRSLLFLEEQLRQRKTSPNAEIRRAPRKIAASHVDLFDPPPLPELRGIGFIEFAVDGGAARHLAAWIETFGFRQIGRHRSKDVTLHRQGAVNLVLNAEPGSFARSYFLVHGPSICAMGLRTGDALAALGRAEALGCARYDGRVGPHEAAIPAVRALDGSLIYFIADEAPDPWQTDFILEERAPEAGLGLAGVDHLAQALPGGQFDSWVLFYRAVLGLEPAEIWELPDPYGLIRSRAVASRNRAVRLSLNISASPNTATARSISTFGGAGIHHIAYSTEDIFATAARMEAAQVPILPVCANYYDDLAARMHLTPPFVEKLRRHNILYDRIGDGEYFQLYTEPFDERFFFEIVQRSGGYDFYGAANAPVRMAMQARRRELAALSVALR